MFNNYNNKYNENFIISWSKEIIMNYVKTVPLSLTMYNVI